MQSYKSLNTQLVAATVSVVLSAFALSAATYAWYVANTKVSATTSTISATTNGFILQIDELKNGAQHGGEQKSLEAQTVGATLSPSSTDDLKNWYVCNGWNNQGLVTDYSTPSFSTTANALPGEYEVAGKKYNAFIQSDYIVYTITDTGTADVYLDASDGAPVTIEPVGGEASETMVGSLRVAITTQEIGRDGKSGTGPEDLRVVYAIHNETGKGNDANAIEGWTSIQNKGGTRCSRRRPTSTSLPAERTDGLLLRARTVIIQLQTARSRSLKALAIRALPFTSTFGWKEPTRIALTANPSRTVRRPITSALSSPVSQRRNADVRLNPNCQRPTSKEVGLFRLASSLRRR